MRRSWIVITLVFGLVAPAAGNLGTDTSPSYAYATWRERDGRITVLVDSLSASFHDDDRYVPLPVAVGVEGYDGPVTVTPETFTLVDQVGRVYAAAANEEIARQYPKIFFDQALTRSRPVTAQQFALSQRLPSRFYTTGSERRIDRVHLVAYSWFRDVIYFPRPEAGLGGVLTLRLYGGGIDPPIEVRFRVPLPGVKIR